MNYLKNQKLNRLIRRAEKLCKPEKVVLIDGSKELYDSLLKQAVSTGEMIPLNEQKLPNCFLHRSAVNDVARVEGRTFICCDKREDAGPTNNWMAPDKAYSLLEGIFDGCMKGRTMYVIPYSMGKVGSPFAKTGIEITDSLYVVFSMNIMTRVGSEVLDALGENGDFVEGLHSTAQLDEEKRYICHFPQDNAIWSVNSGYGGNVLLGKKCFALRIASCQARDEGWMAEHMLILGLTKPDGKTRYICAAFPSACGKTNLAMLIPPEGYMRKGYKITTVGDDIAWLRPGKNGGLYAVNPENGFFGVAPGTNAKSNPNALASTSRDTIFTNVVQNLDDNTVWWEGLGEAPENALDWKGQPWNKDSGVKGAHPNSRFTAPAKNCPCLSDKFEEPEGVKISAIVFGGRRAKTVPLVYQSKSWEHGVFMGSVMASETTAAATGAVGVLRRDPMAMLPFCGYNMGDYFAHWLEMGKIKDAPKIFNVNWFLTDEDGKFLWPGFGDNLRVLDWIIDRCEDNAPADDTPIGYVPRPQDINLEGLDLSTDSLNELLEIDREQWRKETELIEEHYAKFDILPEALKKELDDLKARLK